MYSLTVSCFSTFASIQGAICIYVRVLVCIRVQHCFVQITSSYSLLLIPQDTRATEVETTRITNKTLPSPHLIPLYLYYLLLTTYYLLITPGEGVVVKTYFIPLTTKLLVTFTFYYVLITNYYLLFTIYSRCGRGSKDLHAPTYYLPLTGYYLPHPTYYVLLTMYFLLQVRRWM